MSGREPWLVGAAHTAPPNIADTGDQGAHSVKIKAPSIGGGRLAIVPRQLSAAHNLLCSETSTLGADSGGRGQIVALPWAIRGLVWPDPLGPSLLAAALHRSQAASGAVAVQQRSTATTIIRLGPTAPCQVHAGREQGAPEHGRGSLRHCTPLPLSPSRASRHNGRASATGRYTQHVSQCARQLGSEKVELLRVLGLVVEYLM